MRLTVQTDYALRVLMHVAVHDGERPTIAQIAAAYGISRNHVMKVVHQLGLAGFLETRRGQGGGIRLARPAREIIVGDVVRRTEPDMALVTCLEPGNGSCAITPACVLRGALQRATDAFLAELDRVSLADLVANGAAIRALLATDGQG